MEKVICAICGKECLSDGFGTGYGIDSKTNQKICYDCCGKQDYKFLDEMKVGDKALFYLRVNKRSFDFFGKQCTEESYEVINWPGTMRISANGKIGKHNIAGIRRDVWFYRNGKEFHGIQYGNYSEICHIRRNK